jgi:hypothetical protein
VMSGSMPRTRQRGAFGVKLGQGDVRGMVAEDAKRGRGLADD